MIFVYILIQQSCSKVVYLSILSPWIICSALPPNLLWIITKDKYMCVFCVNGSLHVFCRASVCFVYVFTISYFLGIKAFSFACSSSQSTFKVWPAQPLVRVYNPFLHLNLFLYYITPFPHFFYFNVEHFSTEYSKLSHLSRDSEIWMNKWNLN